jgi:branched-chain amino acid transport system permease protein
MAISMLLSEQLLFGAFATAAVYALVAIGLNLVYGTMKLLNVAHGEFVMLGAYAAYWAFTLLGVSPLISACAVVLAGGACGVALYKGLFVGLLTPGKRLDRLESNSLLLFFGISVILQNLATMVFRGTPRGYEYLSDVMHVGGLLVTSNRLVSTALALAVVGSIALFLRFHPLGLSMRALIERREAAVVVGVDVNRVQLLSFALSFATAGLAGALISMSEQISPFIGFQFTVAAFIVVILGGIGNIAGGIAAAFVLGFIETYGVAMTSGTWRSILLYGLFVTIIVVRPQGLFGKMSR